MRVVILLAFLGLTLNPAFAQNVEIPSYEQSNLAALMAEKRHLEATIRSAEDLELYLTISKHVSTPFSYFGSDAFARFSKSLTFSALGLTSFDAEVVSENLSMAQASELFELFGQANLAQLLYDPVATIQCSGGSIDQLCDDNWVENYRCSTECVGSAANWCNLSSC